jgi:murein DD-endopeptidase MepM/ murein hydrolase activator NlpD
MRAGRVLSSLLLAASLVAATLLARPYAERMVRLVRLVTADPPSRLPMPVAVPREAVADTWGAPRSGGRVHQGVDLFAARGTPVLSTTEGVLVNVGENRLGGRTVLVLGPGGQRHYYAHLDRYGAFDEGDWVQSGAVIGFVGSTGNAAGGAPHLHYGIYDGGEAIDPLPLLDPAARRPRGRRSPGRQIGGPRPRDRSVAEGFRDT